MTNDGRRGFQFSGRTAINQSVVLVALLVAMPLVADAITLGQIDNFQDGTAQNWQTGAGPVSTVTDGGPTGAGDHYLQAVASGGGGSDSRLVVFNSNQWQGDYIDAGITGITLSLDNFSLQPLSIRLAFFVSKTSGYVVTTPFSLAATSGWQNATFGLTAANFTAVGSPGAFNTLLTNFTGQLRILDASGISLQGDSIAATLGIDNVQAVPEPSTIMMVGIGTGLGVILLLCRRYKMLP